MGQPTNNNPVCVLYLIEEWGTLNIIYLFLHTDSKLIKLNNGAVYCKSINLVYKILFMFPDKQHYHTTKNNSFIFLYCCETCTVIVTTPICKSFFIGVSAVWSGEPGNGLSRNSVSLWDCLQWVRWSGMAAFFSVLAGQASKGTMHPLIITL